MTDSLVTATSVGCQAMRPRPRTIAHPGLPHSVRIEHMGAARARHFRLAVPSGRSLFEGLTEALAGVGVHNASMTLLGGALAPVVFCIAAPDPSGRVAAAYSAPMTIHAVQLLFGNATLGTSLAGAPALHCHGVFRAPEGRVCGGHILTEETFVGAMAVTVLVTSLDGFDLQVTHDEETCMPLLRPREAVRHG